MIDKQVEMNEHQPLARHIKYWGLSAYLSILSHIKFGITEHLSTDGRNQQLNYHSKRYIKK